MNQALFAINTVAPVFLLIALGKWLTLRGILTKTYIRQSSRLVFSLTLPALLFSKITSTPFSLFNEIELVAIIYAGVIGLFILVWVIGAAIIRNPQELGVLLQASGRSNLGIIGLAVIANVLGEGGLARGALLLAFIVPLYNVLAVVALTVPQHAQKRLQWGELLRDIIKNPLIIAAVVALAFSTLNLSLPTAISQTIAHLAGLSLPLALLGIGGMLESGDIGRHAKLAIPAAALKLMLAPLLVVPLAAYLGYGAEDLLLLFIVFGCPTAVASFIMADAMTDQGPLAGSMVMLSTVASAFTLAAGVYLIKAF